MDEKATILVVDDQAENRLILDDLLQPNYVVHPAPGGEEALNYLAASHAADLILLDVMMPRMNGFEVCRRLKSNPASRDIPVLFLTSLESAAAEAEGLSLGAEDFIHKPFSPPVVLARVRNHLQLAAARRALQVRNENLEALVAERTQEIVRQAGELVSKTQEALAAQSAIITALCSLAEARDNETGNHIRRTQNYILALAERLRHHPRFRDQLDDETIQLLYKAAPLHDIGKVGIPDAILNKPGRLTPEEFEMMKRHSELGRNVIQEAEAELSGHSQRFLRCAREVAYSHHERWDGTGYPDGLAGDAIPLGARLMAVADVYDALISRRVYKPPLSHEQAIAMILAARGTHFDPDVADAMAELADRFADIATEFSDPEEEAG